MKVLEKILSAMPIWIAIGLVILAVTAGGNARSEETGTSVYDFTVKNIDGEDVSLSKYKGFPLLIVNTASKCGYTKQYASLQKLYDQYKDKGLKILAFPANNFLNQEPGSDAEIKSFCQTNYNVTFDLFAKISVAGDDIHPLYKYLTNDSPFEGDITWNFNKFLVDKNGVVTARFGSAIDPLSTPIIEKIDLLE
jgi:glutathione peroxidase